MFGMEKKPKSLIKKNILAFLERTCGQPDINPGKYGCGMIHRNCLVLATSYNNMPRATPLEFFHEGLVLYIFGEPGGKIANIKRNRQVCAAIYEQPLDHSKHQMSLQIFGTAELINMRNNPRLLKAKAHKWNLYGVLKTFMKAQTAENKLTPQNNKIMADKFLSAINLIKITPNHIIVREYHPDIRMPKYEWKK
jgi:nitroimidazol reductase NimA-like FMN-containing flavoprotein (pyridoxamine 5'-phosphate oxidase superfamily)